MHSMYFALVLIPLVGVSLVNGQQCDGPTAWKKPESCCNFNLIERSVLKECKGANHGHGGGGGGGGGGGKNKPGDVLKGSCMIECAFNATGLYTGTLVEAQVRSVFTNAVSGNAALTTALNTALGTCLPLARSRSAEFATDLANGLSKCNPTSTFVFACVTTNLLANCPAADFHANDPTCVTMQTYYKRCPNIL